ncbi:MAG: hypothetical protein ACRCSR_02335 [Bacteroidales bacterium]
MNTTNNNFSIKDNLTGVKGVVYPRAYALKLFLTLSTLVREDNLTGIKGVRKS